MTTTHLIVGGGTAGCVVAGRLSEDPRNRVLLVEAGADHTSSEVPADIAASYAGRALYNRNYFWQGMTAARNGSSPPIGYEQARLLGGGSSINGQVALRGAPSDYDRWEELGATGWGWPSVLPYFRKLETDLDFVDQNHGSTGPIRIRRFPEDQWDGFTSAVVEQWTRQGYARRQDMNGTLEEGVAAVPVSHDGTGRNSTALRYLTPTVRARPNLTILPESEALRLVVRNRRVTGVEIRGGGATTIREADHVVLCAGALRTPWLLLKSGIGPAGQLRDCGIDPLVDLKGVGRNLQDHPTISVVAYMSPRVRRPVARHNFVNLVYSSGLEGTPEMDMVTSAICKTAWHALGDRLGALSTYIGKPYSRGFVELDRHKPDAAPLITFNWLSDDRDVRRARESFRMMAETLQPLLARGDVTDMFAAGFSPKVKKIGALTQWNRLLTGFAGLAMDASSQVRRQIITRFASDGLSLDRLLGDDGLLDAYLRNTATGIWHPCGTCAMGRASDEMAVVDALGSVYGIDNLSVADASIIPDIPTTNLNIPVIMIGEKIADALKQRRPA